MKRLTPMRAIRANCLECSGGNQAEVRSCVISTCPLFPYRMGKNPYRKPRDLSEAQLTALRDRLASFHKRKQVAGHPVGNPA
jgi:hypothetical protein